MVPAHMGCAGKRSVKWCLLLLLEMEVTKPDFFKILYSEENR